MRLPVEFADAAFRYGHGQFRPIGDRSADPAPLVDLPGRPRSPQRVTRLDGRLAASLIRLPLEITGTLDQEHHQSPAVRDLQRGLVTGLPSGEAIAREPGVEPLIPEQVGVAEHGWVGETPLWYYVLEEAEVCASGRHLGPVGGRIVAEVLTAVVERDPTSYLALEPGWSPPTARDGQFGLGDLLALP